MIFPPVSLTLLDHDIVQIDLMYAGTPRVCAAYLITRPIPVLIETGPKPSIPYILGALKRLHIKPGDLRYVIITHIHLDHAGGAGTLLQYCPYATLIVHAKGVRHLLDPGRLLAGARQTYGDVFFNKIGGWDPISAERIYSPAGTEPLDIGNGRVLTFLDTPGHAYHHLCIHDSQSRGIFCGDTAGGSFPELEDMGISYYVPSTSPTQFNPTAMIESLNNLAGLRPQILYHTHFGAAGNATDILLQLPKQVKDYVDIATEFYPPTHRWQDIQAGLWHYHQQDLIKRGFTFDVPPASVFKGTLELSAKGLAHYMDTMATTS